jgi:DNA-binding LacI/PurR family transcriptional regulator
MKRKEKPAGHVTMDDVARLAGVAKSTVSHVINSTAPITPRTRDLVMDSIRQLNYRPNNLARGLRQNQTRTLGLIIPDIGNEFYAQFARGVMNTVYPNDYTVMLCSTQYDREREEKEVNRLLGARVDGLFLIGGYKDRRYLLSVRNTGVPIVLADRHLPNSDISSVEFDNKKAVSTIVARMVKAGYTRIGYLSEPVTMTNLAERFEGYKAGLIEHGILFDESLTYFRKSLQLDKVGTAQEVMSGIIDAVPRERLPQAIITTSDLIAIGAIKAVVSRGLTVPDDVAFTGFDDIRSASFIDPPLTTVAQDADTMGRIAAELLIQSISKQDTSARHIWLDPRIVVRKSCILPET